MAQAEFCAPRSPEPDKPSLPPEKYEAGHIEILFPYDFRPPNAPEKSFQDLTWQRNGYKNLVQVAKNFQQFNKERVPIDPEKQAKEFSAMLPDGDKALTSNQPLLARLKELSQLRGFEACKAGTLRLLYA